MMLCIGYDRHYYLGKPVIDTGHDLVLFFAANENFSRKMRKNR